MISLSLGLINLFPFLPLDGGHIFWSLVEKVRGRPVPFSVMERAGAVGFVLVIMLFFIGLYQRHRPAHRRGLRRAVAFRCKCPAKRGGEGGGSHARLSATRAAARARSRRADEPLRGVPGDGRAARRRRRDPHRGRQRRLELERLRGAGRSGSPAGSPALGVGKGDTVAMMLNNRPEFIPCDLAAVALGGGPVLDLPDLLAGADRLRRRRRRRQGRDRRDAPSCEQFEEARKDLPELEHLIVIDGDGGPTTLEELEAARPRLRSRRARGRGRPRRPADPDLHLRHHRAAEGRAAHPPQPDGADQLGRGHDRAARARRQGHLLAARRPHRRARRPLLPAGGSAACR